MASQLSTESWIHIFSYLEKRTDLHSCLLVNRFWCKIVVQLLWESPFSYSLTNEKFKSVIRTYLKCLSRESIVRLEEAGVKFMIFNENPMFCYSKFLRDLVIDSNRFDLCIYHLVNDLKNKRKQKIIIEGRESQGKSDKDLKVDYDVRKTQQKYSKELDLMFEELIKLICHHSGRIRSLLVSPCMMINYMLKHLRENNDCFQRIESFTFNSLKVNELSKPFKVYELIMALSCASRDIRHIRINGYQKKLGDSLENLLNSQNNLRSLNLEYLAEKDEPAYYEPILSKLNTPKIISSLNSLSFKNIDFGSITQQSMNSLTKLSQNLKVFKVALCSNCSLLCDAIKQCSNLVEFTYETYRFGEDINFLLTILKSSSTSLKYLDIFWIRDDDNDSGSLLKRQELINCISECCTQLVFLKLRRLNSEDLFSIWYGCKQLEVLNFFCSEQSDWNDCLEDLGRLLPCTLKVLTIGHWIEMPFSPMALERFLQGCKERLRKLEIYSLKRLCEHSEYVSVLKNSGICYKLLSCSSSK